MSVKDRVKEFIKMMNLTVKDFEVSINASNGYINSISKSIGLDKLEIILEIYPNLNIEWLLTGKGEMLKSAGSVAEKESSQSEILALLRWKVSKLEEENAELKKELRAKDPGPVTPAKSELKSER